MVELKNSRGTVDAELPTCRSELTPSKLRLTVLAAVLLGTGQSGSGLGWSIVQRIARLHGLRVAHDRSPTLGGLRVTITWP